MIGWLILAFLGGLAVAYVAYAALIAPMLDDVGARECGDLVPARLLAEARERATAMEKDALAAQVRLEAERAAHADALSEQRRFAESLLVELRDTRRESRAEREKLLNPVLGFDTVTQTPAVAADEDDDEEERLLPHIDDFAERIAAVAREEGMDLDVPAGERP